MSFFISQNDSQTRDLQTNRSKLFRVWNQAVGRSLLTSHFTFLVVLFRFFQIPFEFVCCLFNLHWSSRVSIVLLLLQVRVQSVWLQNYVVGKQFDTWSGLRLRPRDWVIVRLSDVGYVDFSFSTGNTRYVRQISRIHLGHVSWIISKLKSEPDSKRVSFLTQS